MKKRKQKKQYFIQDWGTYSNQTLVVVGMKHEEIVSLMKRLKFDKEGITNFDTESKKEDEADKAFAYTCKGFMWFDDQGRSVLWFREWTNDWDHYDTLLHEIYHGVHHLMHLNKKMVKEEEACAYQMEYLFRSIRRKLK